VVLFIWEWMTPDKDIDIARDFKYNEYITNRAKYGDHVFKVDLNNNNI
jgi:hypothetical protein